MGREGLAGADPPVWEDLPQSGRVIGWVGAGMEPEGVLWGGRVLLAQTRPYEVVLNLFASLITSS